MPRYIGLISGTSMDGIDAALVSLCDGARFRFELGRTSPLPSPLVTELHALCQPGGENELRRMMALDRALGKRFALAAQEILRESGLAAADITAIGSHGQTLRHYPEAEIRTSLQVGDPNLIAELTGITTVADFRRRDMAAGGQGAPLAPAFHQFLLGSDRGRRAVLNLGGIANLTLMPAAGDDRLLGFDCGPANTLLDRWAQRNLGQPFDRGGEWAASGRVVPELLDRLLADEYFKRRAPKSTGREHFNLEWLEGRLGQALAAHPPADIQATLAALSAAAVAEALGQEGALPDELLVCGGGVHNPVLMLAIEAAVPDCRVVSTLDYDIDPDYVEAAAFGWLAHRTLDREAGNAPAVTGASHPVILGAVYPGGSPKPG